MKGDPLQQVSVAELIVVYVEICGRTALLSSAHCLRGQCAGANVASTPDMPVLHVDFQAAHHLISVVDRLAIFSGSMKTAGGERGRRRGITTAFAAWCSDGKQSSCPSGRAEVTVSRMKGATKASRMGMGAAGN